MVIQICESKKFAGFFISKNILEKIDETAKTNGISRSEQIRSDLIKIYGVKNEKEA